jgi:hypothetical protein
MFVLVLLINIFLVRYSSALAVTPWSIISTTNPPGTLSDGRSAYCEARDSILIFGGVSIHRIPVPDQVYEYSTATSTWVSLTQSYPQQVLPKKQFSMTALPTGSSSGVCQALLLGGVLTNSTKVSPLTWLLSVQSNNSVTWELLTNDTLAVAPIRRSHQAVFRRAHEFYLFGGVDSVFSASNELWKFEVGTLQNGSRSESKWSQILKLPEQLWPQGRSDHVMVMRYDTDEFIIHGGRDVTPQGHTYDDVWIYSFASSTWRILAILPFARYYHAGWIQSDRLFLFGGLNHLDYQYGSYVFNSLYMTILPDTLLDQTEINKTVCLASKGNWCTSTSSSASSAYIPSERGMFAFAARGDETDFYVYGGFGSVNVGDGTLGDLWKLNSSQAVSGMILANREVYSASDLSRSLFFVVGILSMIIVCFIVFTFTKGRSNTAPNRMFFAPNRPRVYGARASFIGALPLKTYKKTAIQDENLEQAQARKNSIRQRRASHQSNHAINLTEIAQDDLHDLCAICLTDYDDGEQLRVLPCSHFFHPECVDTWVLKHNACPMCKAQVDPEPVEIFPIQPNAASVAQLVVVQPQHVENPLLQQAAHNSENAGQIALTQLNTNPEQPRRSPNEQSSNV